MQASRLKNPAAKISNGANVIAKATQTFDDGVIKYGELGQSHDENNRRVFQV